MKEGCLDGNFGGYNLPSNYSQIRILCRLYVELNVYIDILYNMHTSYVCLLYAENEHILKAT